jgi:hypothetical protein
VIIELFTLYFALFRMLLTYSGLTQTPKFLGKIVEQVTRDPSFETRFLGWSCVSPVILAPRHPVLDFTLCFFIPQKAGDGSAKSQIPDFSKKSGISASSLVILTYYRQSLMPLVSHPQASNQRNCSLLW